MSSPLPLLERDDDCLDGRGEAEPLLFSFTLSFFFLLGISPFFAFSTALRKASALLSSLNFAPYLSMWTKALASFFSLVSGLNLLTRTPPGKALVKMDHFSSCSR